MNEDRFANELDRIASGQEPQDPDALAAFARDVQMHQGATRLDPDRHAGIRRSLMQHATTLSTSKSTTGGAGPLSQPALTDPALHNPWVRRRPAVTRTPSGWRGHMVKAQTAIAIMTVFALLIVGSAWITNQQGGDGGPGPSATRYAAAPTQAASIIADDGTPASGIFENDFDWTAPIDPAECRSYRQSPPSERIQNIRAERREFPKRQYVPFSFPAEDDAAEVAATARLASACANDHQNWLFRSDRWFYENDNPNIPDEHAFDMEDQLRASMEVSAALANYPVTDFVILLDQPLGVMTVPVQGQAFQPHHVVQLADGRLAIPSTQLMYIDSASDEWPFSTTEDWPFTLSTAFVLAQQPDGTWLVDEELAICIGDCNAMWSDAAEAFGVLAVPEIAEVAPVERREPSNKTAPNVATPPTNATPEAIADDVSPLLQLLSVLPAPLAIAEDGVLPGWAYADIDQRFEDLGLTDEALADDPTLPLASNAYGPLAHTTPLFDYAADTEFVEAIGFNPLEVDQVLITGRAPDVLTLLRGDWDEDTLTTAWEASGYTPHTTMDGVTIWSLDPDGWVDPQHPIQRRMFQQLNNVAILDGGILAYAGYSGTIEMVIQTQSGEMASAIDDAWLQPLFSAVSDETISGIGFTQPGSTLYDLGEIAANPNLTPDDRASIEDQLRASREAVGPMPEYRGAIFAVEGDPAGEGAIVVQMRAFSGEDAEQIVRVIEWRWQNLTSQRYQRTFDSIMPLIDATTHDDIVTLRFDPQGAPRMWLELLQGGDLLVFAVDAMAPVVSPVSSPQAVTGAPTKITDLLAAIPAEMPGQEEGPNVGWTYADVEQQLADMGFTTEEAVADPLQVIGSMDFASIAWTSGIFRHSTDEEFVAAIGFNPFTAHQALGAFTFHDSLTVLRGDWDKDALVTAWEAAGYTPYTTSSGVTAWTTGPDAEIDPAHPIQTKVFSLLNNVAILDGGIILYASTMDTLELALSAHAGEAESARDDANIAPMLSTVPENTVSLVAFDQPGSAMFDLERQIEINPNIRPEDAEQMIEELRAPLRESREAVGTMPDYHGVLFGITGGADAEVFVRMGAGSEEDAAQIATVVEWRWDHVISQRNQRPLDTVMKVTDATSEGTTAMLAFDPLGNPRIWRDLLHGNDLMPFAVDREDADASPVATPES
jgi:hypothetical protein